jgi:hypothetical protein
MTARFRRRRSRERRLAIDGDFPDTGETITELIRAVQPPDYDTIRVFSGASAGTMPLAETAGTLYAAPVGASPPRTHSAAGKGWTMTVNTDGPGAPWNPRLHATHTFLKLKWAYLEQRGMGYRVDEADQVMQRGEELPAGSLIAEAHREAVTHLIGDFGEYIPAGGWNHGWAEDLPWYRPEDGDDGLPIHRVTS